MKVVYLLSYPIYHDFWTKEQWLNIINQNRWIPGIISNLGYESEFWVVDKTSSEHKSELKGFGNYTIRMFKPNSFEGKTKFHISDELVNHAKKNKPDLFFIKGVDGGIADHLISSFLKDSDIPFVMVSGGQYHHPNNKYARFIIYESEYQKDFLIQPRFFFWRTPIPESKLIRLQKSIDIDVFRPIPTIKKEYDSISVGRIVQRNKRFDEIGELAKHAKVAVLGDGPYKEVLMKKFPEIIWLDRVSNSEVPEVLNKAKTYIHPSAKDWVITRDFYPRAIAEALACGLPCIGFDDAIQKDIIPNDCGIIVKRKEVVSKSVPLFTDPEKLSKMSYNARKYASENIGKYSAKPVLEKVLNHFR